MHQLNGDTEREARKSTSSNKIGECVPVANRKNAFQFAAAARSIYYIFIFDLSAGWGYHSLLLLSVGRCCLASFAARTLKTKRLSWRSVGKQRTSRSIPFALHRLRWRATAFARVLVRFRLLCRVHYRFDPTQKPVSFDARLRNERLVIVLHLNRLRQFIKICHSAHGGNVRGSAQATAG